MSEGTLLSLLRQATRSGSIVWSQLGPGRYEAEVDGRLYIIEMEHPIVAGGGEAYTCMYRVVIDGVLITFADGSPFVEILQETLAIEFAEWAETLRFMKVARQDAADNLQAMLGRSAPNG